MVPDPDGATRVTALSYRYGARWALEGIDLTVAAGEALAVLGPNGAGKSTLIATMPGLRAPTRGTLEIHGLAPQAEVRQGRVAGMLQASALPQFAPVAASSPPAPPPP